MNNSVLAVDRYVAVTGDDGNSPYTSWNAPAQSIDAALSVAVDGDTIYVSNGTYAISPPLVITNLITLQSQNGPESTIINAGGTQRGIWIGKISGATVSGFTITNGYHSTIGAGVILYSGDNLITNCIIKGNRTGSSGQGGGIGFYHLSYGRVVDTTITANYAKYGGGVYFSDRGSISNCTIVKNYANTNDGFGGGAYISGNGDIYNSLISENYAGYDGGGIYCSNTGARIIGNTVSSNSSGWDGAGIYLYMGGTVSNCNVIQNYGATNAYGGGITIYKQGYVNHSTIANNYAGYDGGGIYCNDGGNITDCMINDNRVDGDGAGIYMITNGAATNCTIQNNTCSGKYTEYGRGGGLVLNAGGNAHGCTIQNNVATDAGGGIFMTGLSGGVISSNGPGTIYSCSILANRALRGGGIWASGGEVWNSTIIDNTADGFATYAGGLFAENETILVNNIIYYNEADSDPDIMLSNTVWGLYYSCTPILPSSPPSVGSISASPGLISFPFAAHEYHITSNSPCRNVGNNRTWMTDDIDLQPRIQQSIVDMGADEFAPIPPGFNADAGANSTSGEGSLIAFDASGSTDGGGSALKYRWYFGDGSTPGDWQTAPTTTYSYGSAGVYTSQLIVLNDISLDTDTRIITITNVPPAVDAGGPYSAYLNQPITITVSATATGDYNILKYRFDFNGQGWSDWNTSTSSNWTYTATGQTSVYVQCGKFMDFMDPHPASTGSAVAVVNITSNTPPTITRLNIYPEDVWLDSELLVSVTAYDPNTNDVLEYSYNWSGTWTGWAPSSNAYYTYTNGGLQTIQVRVSDNIHTSAIEQTSVNIIVADAQSMSKSNGHPNISWSVVADRSYIIQQAEDLINGIWTNVSPVVTATENTLDFLATNDAPSAIYRSVLAP